MRRLKVVHLPVYDSNPYQDLLFRALNDQGVEAIVGGAGGYFFRTAMFKWKPDILHFHWIHPYLFSTSTAGTIARSTRLMAELSLLRLAGHRIVWTVHNLKNHENSFPKIERVFTQRFVRRVDAMICHCECAKAEAVKFFNVNTPARVHVVPHGNYIGAYPNVVTRQEARSRLGLAEEHIVFLFLGRILAYKGVLELVRQFGRLHAPHARLVIAGSQSVDGGKDELLEATRADPRIFFKPGFVPNDKVQSFMNAADVAVFPYRDVLTSGAVVLAMSYGRACIAIRKGCIAETLDDRGGVLYEVDEPDGLLNAMRGMLERRQKLPAMGEHNLRRSQQWNWDIVAAKTREIYDLVLSGH